MLKNTLLLFLFFFIITVSLIVGETSLPIINGWELDSEVLKNLFQVDLNETTLDALAINKSVVIDHDGLPIQVTIVLNTNTNNNNCSKPKGLGDQCVFNKDCRDVLNSKCFKERCSCKSNYIPADERCKGLIAEPCEEDADCGVGDSVCKNQICRCKIGTYSSLKNRECYPFAGELDDFCDADLGCRFIHNTICSNKSCKCKSNYRQKEKLCLGLTNAWCSEDRDCALRNSVCQSNTCKCLMGFYVYSENCYTYGTGFEKFPSRSTLWTKPTYKLHTTPAKWDDARQICFRENGYLAVIKSKIEEQELIKLWKKAGPIKNATENYNDQAYIGMHKVLVGDHWVSIKGNLIEYVNWSQTFRGHPQPSDPINQKCGSLVESGGMDDVGCHLKLGFFCEIP